MTETIKLVAPRPTVEIQLPDGRVLSGPRSAKVEDFLTTLEYPAQLVAAIINGNLRELTYPIDMDARVTPGQPGRTTRHRCLRAQLAPRT